jgi:5-methylcytosine-specific restriction protein A
VKETRLRICEVLVVLLIVGIAVMAVRDSGSPVADSASPVASDRNVSIELTSPAGGRERSGRWRRVRREHLEIEPDCAACGSSDDLEVHHILPFNEYPELELARGNLITLCREHHWLIGHDADGPGPADPNWSTSNREVVEHAHVWAQTGGW